MLKTNFKRIGKIKDGNDLPRYMIGKEGVITDNGETHVIEKLPSGIEYFRIFNPYCSETDDIPDKLFYGHIADAVKAIREDYADILMGEFDSDIRPSISIKDLIPIVLLDREKGDKGRTVIKYLWKDIEFGWVIKYFIKDNDSVRNPYKDIIITEDGEFGSLILGKPVPKFYNTKDEAVMQFDKWYNEAFEKVKNNDFSGRCKNTIITCLAKDIDILYNISGYCEDDIKETIECNVYIEQAIKNMRFNYPMN